MVITDHKDICWPGWETVRLIGRGSFGEVYEIQREIRGRTEHAALKVISIPHNESEIGELKADGYDDESITQYFTDSLEKIEDEYAMMADLKGHSNVVYCDDIRTVQHNDGFGWDIYIKMELLTPLKSYLSKEVTDTQIIKLGMDICDALKLCEELNIVHRDIKPENIFVSRNGNYKLGDFGIAKTMEGTTGGTKTGTYDYMSPEVYNNLPYRTQTDIYSLGLVMYWLLNNRAAPFLTPKGKKPTPSEKNIARDRRFSGERIPAPKNGSAELKRIVLKACAFDTKDRYQTAREMWEDIARLSGGHTEKFVPDPEPSPDPIVPDDFNDDKTVGPVFRYVPAVDSEDLDKTVGPVFTRQQVNVETHQALKTVATQSYTGREKSLVSKSPKDKPTGVALPNGFWRCVCGRENAAYVSSCACGTNKRELKLIQEQPLAVRPQDEKSTPEPNSIPNATRQGFWNCSCGRVNAAYVSSCACGARKRDIVGKASW